MSYLKLSIIGRVGNDPETRTLESGSKVTKFRVAVSEKYKKGGETVENTTWITVEAWDKQAEVLAEYVKKGNEIHIEGTPKVETWTDKEGNAKAGMVVRVREFSFIGGKSTEAASTATTTPQPATTAGGEDDNLLPF